jgi:hypothetical protein
MDKDMIAVLYGRRKTALICVTKPTKLTYLREISLDYPTGSFSPTKLKFFPTVNALGAKDRNYFVMWNLETGKQIITETQDSVVNFEMDEENRLILFCKRAVKIRAGTNFRSLVSVTAIPYGILHHAKLLENNIFLLMYEATIYFFDLKSPGEVVKLLRFPVRFTTFSWVEEIAPGMISFWANRQTSVYIFDTNSYFFLEFNLPKGEHTFFKWNVLGPRKIILSEATSESIFFLSLDPITWPKMYRYLFLGRTDPNSPFFQLPSEVVYQILRVSFFNFLSRKKSETFARLYAKKNRG